MSQFPWGKFAIYTAGLMGLGYTMMKATTPTEEQLYKEMTPDMKRKVDETRAARLSREASTRKQLDIQAAVDQAPEAAKPVWADSSRRN